MTTEIALLEDTSTAMAVFTAANGLDPYLLEIRAEIDGFTPDLSTAKGRKEIASIAHKVARSKTVLDDIGKQLVADLKKQPALIDAERKRMRDLLDSWKAEVRRPLDEYEAEIAAAEARHAALIRTLTEYLDGAETASQEVLSHRISGAEHADGWEWNGRWNDGKVVAIDVLNRLHSLLSARKEYDKQQAELAEAQEKLAAQQRKLDDEAAQRAADERARVKAEADAAEKIAEASRREGAARAEVDAANLRAERAAQHERDKIEAAAKEEQRQKDLREADKEHRRAIMTAAKLDLIQLGLSEDQAKSVVMGVIAGSVAGMTLNF